MTLLDGPALAAALKMHPQSIRRWASKGKLTRRGTGRHGRVLYDLDEAIAVAAGDTPNASERVDDQASGMVATPRLSSTTVPPPGRCLAGLAGSVA